MSDDLNQRGQKTVDISSTYVQVLIGLSSGIITAILGVTPDLLKVEGLNFVLLKYSLICFGFSIISGLFGLGGLVGATAVTKYKNPPAAKRVTIPTWIQLILFGIGMLLMVYVIPF